MHNFGSFSKVDVPFQGDKDKDVEILKLSRGEEAVREPVTEEAPTSPAKATIAEVPPAGHVAETEATIIKAPPAGPAVETEVVAAEAPLVWATEEIATTECTPTETAPGETTSTEVITTITSGPSGNGRNTSFGDHFSYIVADLSNFAETPALAAPTVGLSQEEVVIRPVLDPVGMNYLY